MRTLPLQPRTVGNLAKKKNPNIKCFRCGKKGHISTEEKKESSDGKDNDCKLGQGSTDQSNEAIHEWSFWVMEEEEITLQAVKANKETWLLDSGTSSHITHDKSILEEYVPLSGHTIKGVGGQNRCYQKGENQASILCVQQSILNDVLYAPDSPHNLISTTQLTAAGGSILSHAIFICSCYHYFDLCLTSTYSITSVFHLPFSYFILWSSEPFAFPSSVFHPPFILRFLITYFHILCSVLCSFVPFLLLSFYHLSIIPCLAFPTLTTYHSIPCDSVSHLFTFSILHHSLYYSKPCSIKFFPILYLLPSL